MCSLRAQPHDRIHCIDASMEAAGGCVSPVLGSDVVGELWRRAQHVGHRTQLATPAAAAARERGDEWLTSDSEEEEDKFSGDEVEEESGEFVKVSNAAVRQHSRWVNHGFFPGPLWDRFPLFFDLLELYAGKASMSKAWARQGLVVAPPIEKEFGWDTLLPITVRWLLWMVGARRLWLLWAAPPCRTKSQALHPPVCTRELPEGLHPGDLDLAEGNFHFLLFFSLAVAQTHAGGLFVGEQPAWAQSR